MQKKGRVLDDFRKPGDFVKGTAYDWHGDSLYDTKEEAIQASERMRKQSEKERSGQQKEAEEKAKADKLKADLDKKLMGFTSDMPDMRKAQTEKNPY